ncbi:MAG: hypothetical protein PGN37_11640 [Mycobacterium kyogaense]|uniref:hypothetical protein n=1 Tax=Mycobacterium kyogaense TaxID=2212479 RepID=UPI002FF62C20
MNHASPTPLATALGDLAVQLHASGTPEATAHTIVMAATTIIPGIGWAGVSLARGETVTPRRTH